jgi:cytochrome c oxidase subunit 2
MIPDQASTLAPPVDTLFFALLALAALFTALVTGLLVFFAIKYRRRSADEVPEQIEDSPRLEVLWTIVPLGLALIVFVWGSTLFLREAQPPADAELIYVLGKQWTWRMQHANGRQEVNELHVPVGRPVRLTMIAQDVIHSFFVPAFRIKQDVLPGRYTTVWFEASRVGTYTMYCAEYCGLDHSGMLAQVTVMDASAYATWLNAGPVSEPAAEGARLFEQLSCGACHHADSGGVGPPLNGLYGRQLRLQDGSAMTADDNYLRESILNPQAKIVEGYPPVMPTFQGRVDEQQLVQLLMYIRSLGSAAPAPSLPAPPARSPTP